MIALILATTMIQAPVPLTTVARGDVSNVMEPQQAVVRTLPEWQQLWNSHSGGDAARPPVDFAKRMVVGVFLGARNTGGYSVEITGVEIVDGSLVVRYSEKTPGAGMMTAQVITAPFHLVSIDRFEGTVRFEKNEKQGRVR